MFYLHTSPHYFFMYLYPSTYPLQLTSCTSSLGINAHPLHMLKPSQSRFPHLVHHRGRSHLLPNNLIPNLATPSMPTHLSQHPHLHNMHHMNM
uniref:Putative ovule protein n=1 Tax=Solanum chacoense TaxID=4108 RepID=A0A0V0IGF3_SOLCH